MRPHLRARRAAWSPTSAAGPGFYTAGLPRRGRAHRARRRQPGRDPAARPPAAGPPWSGGPSSRRWPTTRWTWRSPPTCSSTSPTWRATADEIVRVVRPGGLVVLSYTVWLGPVGRPRDLAVALPRRAPRRPAVRAADRPAAQERLRRVACSPRRAGDGLAWLRGTPRPRGPRPPTALPAAGWRGTCCGSRGCARSSPGTSGWCSANARDGPARNGRVERLHTSVNRLVACARR